MTDLIIETNFDYSFTETTDCLLQIEAAHFPGQTILEEALTCTPVEDFNRVSGEAGLGSRAWFGVDGAWQATYKARVAVDRPDIDVASLPGTLARYLPSDATAFLMPSRYCQSDVFEPVLAREFPDLVGGALAAAIRDWVYETMEYVVGSSGEATTATDSYMAGQGVCRDYAHVVIAMARAGGIPARMVSCYAPDVDPPDLHAVAELWLAGAWHMVDATGMSKASDTAVIGVGRDAADVSFLTMMGVGEMLWQSVSVTRG